MKNLCNVINGDNKRATFDGYKDKVGCVIYGTMTEMSDALSNMKKTSEKNKDNIAGVVCLEINDVLSILKIIKDNKYRFLDKFYWNENKTYEYGFYGRYYPTIN